MHGATDTPVRAQGGIIGTEGIVLLPLMAKNAMGWPRYIPRATGKGIRDVQRLTIGIIKHGPVCNAGGEISEPTAEPGTARLKAVIPRHEYSGVAMDTFVGKHIGSGMTLLLVC